MLNKLAKVWVWKDADPETCELIQTAIKEINPESGRNYYAVDCDPFWRSEEEISPNREMLIAKARTHFSEVIEMDTNALHKLLDEVAELNQQISQIQICVKKLQSME